MKLRAVLLDAKKAVACGASIEGAAVVLGLIDNAEAGYITAALGAVSTALVFLLKNVPATPAAPLQVAQQVQAIQQPSPTLNAPPTSGSAAQVHNVTPPTSTATNGTAQ